jgi:hypothetical protein
MTLRAVDAEPGDPATFTIATTRYAGQSALGLLAFEPPDPTACTTPAGTAPAGIRGVLGLGGLLLRGRDDGGRRWAGVGGHPVPRRPWQPYFSAARISPAARSPLSTAQLR